MSKLIGQLFSGPVDIIGDIHGEIDSLVKLLRQLSYDDGGLHPEGRRLVFLGDLIDRGPDSPAVVEKVSHLVRQGRAQCILGNHELNLLRNDKKEGNGWYMDPAKTGKYPFTPVTERQKKDFQSFFAQLPLALEREDLRVVHACWRTESVAKLAELDDSCSVLDAFQHFEARLKKTIKHFELTAEIRNSLKDRTNRPVLIDELARNDSQRQMGNPVRVLSSGEEAPAQKPFWAGGKWRMVKREKWWESYRDRTPVVVGHYWRYASNDVLKLTDKHGPDLFEGVEPHHWMGAHRNVFCVDFSVGLRYKARANNHALESFKLAALKWPEELVIDEDGISFDLA